MEIISKSAESCKNMLSSYVVKIVRMNSLENEVFK